MKLRNGFNLLLFLLLFIFSAWLMHKSFGYNPNTYQFRVARNQVGDFGLHLSLIRSFSIGNNFPPQSPFFPGAPMPYHYGLDLIVGMLERVGIRIDIALNTVSALFFALLLYTVYRLAGILFQCGRGVGILAILLTAFPSSLTFYDYFVSKPISSNILSDIWRIPDYIHKGPYDGSLISIFFTINVFLNQRHFIVALSISFLLFAYVLQKIVEHQDISLNKLVLFGFLFGFVSRIHSLMFFGTGIVVFLVIVFFKKYHWLLPFFIPMGLSAIFHILQIIDQITTRAGHIFIHVGYLTPSPVTVGSFMKYWLSNLGLKLLLMPIVFLLTKSDQRKIYASFFALFIIANVFRLGFRIEHNQSLIQIFLILTNIYVAYVVIGIWKVNAFGKFFSAFLVLVMTASGILDLMAVKNDFSYPVSDIKANPFMSWIVSRTPPNAVFLARQDILDPVTLAGRKNYFGSTYYAEVMGYNYGERRGLAKRFFEATSVVDLTAARSARIGYLVIPNKEVSDFFYDVHRDFLASHLPIIYSDVDVSVYQL